MLLLSASWLAAASALAQPSGAALSTEEPPAAANASPDATPYDDRLARLAELLGSVHYLRNLCTHSGGDDWRVSMQQLLDSETRDEPKRREKLTAAFNRGYRTFASVYTDCTAAAIVAEERYRNEGATLATEITSRFGN
ncbi:uncharacterized protein (TIGR02301 family) [Rhizobium sp. BK251]|nr:uncharacterized protein (TIGR02301 family) [Rhizobium sp. BK251]